MKNYPLNRYSDLDYLYSSHILPSMNSDDEDDN